MIVVKLMGGLGNQMFQYAFGKYLAVKNKTRLKADLNFLLDRAPRENMVFRDYDLDVFGIKLIRCSASELRWYVTRLPKTKKEEKRFAWYQRLTGVRYLREESHYFDPLALGAGPRSYLDGYWQNEQYFKGIEATIREDFTIRRPDSVLLREFDERLGAGRSVCVNVRRADFVTVPDARAFHGVCDTAYYRRAIAYLSERVEDLRCFVFSDDIEWCRGNLGFLPSVTFVDHRQAGPKFSNYLRLMSLCDYFIIPNSSFGWWAAWLARAPHKIVIYPEMWFSGIGFKGEHIAPREWVAM